MNFSTEHTHFDIESLLRTKSYDALTEEQRIAISEIIGSREEYEMMRTLLQNIDMEAAKDIIYPESATKDALVQKYKLARAGRTTAKPASKRIAFSVLWAAAAVGILLVAYLFFATIRQEQNIPDIAQTIEPHHDNSKTSSESIKQAVEEDFSEELPETALEENEEPPSASTLAPERIDQVMKDKIVMDFDSEDGTTDMKKNDPYKEEAEKSIALAEDVIRTKTQNAIVTTSGVTGTALFQKSKLKPASAYEEKQKSGRALSEDIAVVDILFTCL